jgi:D-sedoheptulose 7-phosphate isomerase
LEAFQKAKTQGVYTIAFTGAMGGKMKDACELCLAVPSTNTPRIQESQIMMGHILCDLVEQAMEETSL